MSKENSSAVDRYGKTLINQLAAIIRTSQIHDPSNVAVLQALDKLTELLSAFISETGAAALELVGDYFFINETRVKFSMENLMNFDYLAREFRKLKLGSVTFEGEVTKAHLQDFVKAFLSAAFSGEPYDDLEEAVSRIDTVTIGIPRVQKQQVVGEQVEDIKKTVKKTYFNAVSFTKGVMNRIRHGEQVNIKRAKRVVQSMVDILMQEEELLMGMTAIKDYDDYTYHHSVNVSIVSIALGQRLALSKQMLLELGLVALFHDAGKMQVPTEVLNKPAAFTEEEWKIVKRHPIWGVRAILRMKGFDYISVKAAIVAFEHHIRLDDSGYPKRTKPMKSDLYSRIVSIADQYDGMTSARVYSRTPMTPEKALSLMMERAGTQLDPLLFKFFVNMVGVYPVGTAVMLNTKELALVYGNNMMFPDKPRVMVITDSNGSKTKGLLVDMSEKGEDGKFKYSIVKTLDPIKYKINLAEYML